VKKEREVSGRTKSITQVGDGMKASGNRNYSKLGKQIKHNRDGRKRTADGRYNKSGKNYKRYNKKSGT